MGVPDWREVWLFRKRREGRWGKERMEMREKEELKEGGKKKNRRR